jgi:hypothetical protein
MFSATNWMEKLAVDQLVDKSDTFTTFLKAHQ